METAAVRVVGRNGDRRQRDFDRIGDRERIPTCDQRQRDKSRDRGELELERRETRNRERELISGWWSPSVVGTEDEKPEQHWLLAHIVSADHQ